MPHFIYRAALQTGFAVRYHKYKGGFLLQEKPCPKRK